MFAAIPFDQQLTDTYFVVAHFHYVIFGAAVFPLLGGMYYWFPKVTGRMYYERWGQASFWLTFIGMNITFFPMHLLGLAGMPRRDYTYSSELGWTSYNLIETLGAYLLAAGLVMVAANLITSLFRGEPAGDDPFGGDTLEWSVSSPPPEYNFAGHPHRQLAVRELGRGGPRGRPAPPGGGRERLRPGPRDDASDDGRRRARRGRSRCPRARPGRR